MGNLFSYYETSFELPDYGDSSFKRDIDIALKYIKILENIDYSDEFYESQSSSAKHESKISYNKKRMNGAVQSIPPSRRDSPEFKSIVSKMEHLGYKPPNPIKYTLIPN